VAGHGRKWLAAAVVVAVLVTGCAAPVQSAHGLAPDRGGHANPAIDPLVHRMLVLGYSVRHRPVIAIELGDPDSPRRVLVVGCIHGSEPAGIAIAAALARGPAPAQASLWIVPDLNPDGVAAGTRQNAHGVDLNRNFPVHWQPLGPPGSMFYSGPRPLSEPESRLAARLILRIRPALAIWYHQALNVVDDSEGPKAAERRYARLTGMREVLLTDYPGSAVGWENATVGPTAFVVELRAGRLSPAAVRRHAAAVRALLT
jgi:protein MpaA